MYSTSPSPPTRSNSPPVPHKRHFPPIQHSNNSSPPSLPPLELPTPANDTVEEFLFPGFHYNHHVPGRSPSRSPSFGTFFVSSLFPYQVSDSAHVGYCRNRAIKRIRIAPIPPDLPPPTHRHKSVAADAEWRHIWTVSRLSRLTTFFENPGWFRCLDGQCFASPSSSVWQSVSRQSRFLFYCAWRWCTRHCPGRLRFGCSSIPGILLAVAWSGDFMIRTWLHLQLRLGCRSLASTP